MPDDGARRRGRDGPDDDDGGRAGQDVLLSIVVLLLVFFTLIVLSVPIAVALGVAVLASSFLYSPIPLPIIGQKLYANLDHFTLMAVPFFFYAAALMESGGLVHHLVRLAKSLVGHFPGGLGMTAILTCVFFAAISGSSPATVAAVGGILYPALVEEGYTEDYAIGALTTAGAIGILIPPSIPLILFGFVTETSIPKLFVAGIVPGIVYGLAMMLMANRLAVRMAYTPAHRADWVERWLAFRQAGPALLLPVVIVVGIYGFPEFTFLGMTYSGGAVFTPTEAAIMAVVLALVIGLFVYRSQRVGDVFRVIVRTTPKVGLIFWIATNAILFGFYLTKLGVPQAVAHWLVGIDMAPWTFLLLVNLVLIIVGLFLEGVPTILLFVPVLYPAAEAIGIDLLHFGIIVVVNIELGLVTPPVGLNLFVGSTVSGLPLERVFRACLPWMVVDILVLLLVTYVPWLSTFLPGLMW
jgi:C4-dicarboxylate transporter DctM subunit